jgi:hypothetical protein
VQAYLVLKEGKETFLGTTPAVRMKLSLGKPGKNLLGLQISCHGVIIGLADEIPDDAGVPVAKVLVHNESRIVSLKAFLHHAKHPEHLFLI